MRWSKCSWIWVFSLKFFIIYFWVYLLINVLWIIWFRQLQDVRLIKLIFDSRTFFFCFIFFDNFINSLNRWVLFCLVYNILDWLSNKIMLTYYNIWLRCRLSWGYVALFLFYLWSHWLNTIPILSKSWRNELLSFTKFIYFTNNYIKSIIYFLLRFNIYRLFNISENSATFI